MRGSPLSSPYFSSSLIFFFRRIRQVQRRFGNGQLLRQGAVFFVFLQRIKRRAGHIWRQFDAGVGFSGDHRFIDIRHAVDGAGQNIFARLQASFLMAWMAPMAISSL